MTIEQFKNPKVKNFTTFYEEKNAPKDEDYNIVIIHVKKEPSPTVKRITEECKKNNIKCYECIIDGAFIEEGKLYRSKDDKGFRIHSFELGPAAWIMKSTPSQIFFKLS